MANGVFDSFKEAILGGGNHGATYLANSGLAGDTIVQALYDEAAGVLSLTTDEDAADLTDADIINEENLASVTVVDGDFKSTSPVTHDTVSGDAFECVLFFDDTPGTSATKFLICQFDSGITGLPLTPNGGDVVVTMNASGYFSM